MSSDNFKTLDWPKFPEALACLEGLLQEGKIAWHGNQICLTTIPGHDDDYALGTGSLFFDWNATQTSFDALQGTSLLVPKKQNPPAESDFSVLCTPFKGTIFQEMYEILVRHHSIGRVRLMQLQPKTCLSWHTDSGPRIHYPMMTHDGCFMVIDEEICHLQQDTWYLTDTVKYHTAFNGSKRSRIHLVAVIL
jgi:Aspartyl/Asparaginyl beta-hydroxylase